MRNRICGVHRDLHVNINSDVSHCVNKSEFIGNINDPAIKDIWISGYADKMRKNILLNKINCHQFINCNIRRDNILQVNIRFAKN
jgi:hypothetical protein